ncbi:hypothetical protein LTR33_005630 [Friedmanniomyces endolithicus]|nr:hypothetical protein LTR33_005630 [Friedmanniomyces endolithicus]
MSLQPTNRPVERDTIAPFLLRVYWQQNREPMPTDFSVAPPADTTDISDYSSLLPLAIRQKSVIIYSWSDCSLAELTGLLTSMLPAGVLPSPAVGTRLVYKLVFPDTRAELREGGKGKWVDKPLGSVVVGGNEAHFNGDEDANGGAVTENLGGETGRTLGDARFVIGDYVVCTIYPPGQDGRIAAMPPSRAPPRMDPRRERTGMVVDSGEEGVIVAAILGGVEVGSVQRRPLGTGEEERDHLRGPTAVATDVAEVGDLIEKAFRVTTPAQKRAFRQY